MTKYVFGGGVVRTRVRQYAHLLAQGKSVAFPQKWGYRNGGLADAQRWPKINLPGECIRQ